MPINMCVCVGLVGLVTHQITSNNFHNKMKLILMKGIPLHLRKYMQLSVEINCEE